MKNKLLRISIAFLTIFLLVLNVCPISVFADDAIDNVFYMPMSKPHVDNNSGYAEVFWSDGAGNKYIDVVSWTFTPILNGSNQDFMPTTNQLLCSTVYSNTLASFSFRANDNCDGYFAWTSMSNTGRYLIQCFVMDGTTAPLVKNLTDSNGHTIHGFHFYGNVQTTNGSPSVLESFSVVYAEDAVITSDLANILTTLNVLYYQTELYLPEFEELLGSIDDDLSNFKGSFDEFVEYYKSKMILLLSYCEDFFQQLKTIATNTGDAVNLLDSLLQDFRIYMDELYWLELDSNTKLYEIKDTLDAILAILNAGKDKPTLQTPNDSIDSAFGDVSGWFGDIDGFGNQLEQNRQENQQNLAQAGNIISGFFSICPPQIIIALALCAIMIVVAKVIGR